MLTTLIAMLLTVQNPVYVKYMFPNAKDADIDPTAIASKELIRDLNEKLDKHKSLKPVFEEEDATCVVELSADTVDTGRYQVTDRSFGNIVDFDVREIKAKAVRFTLTANGENVYFMEKVKNTKDVLKIVNEVCGK